jgi:hypothetical protein
MASSPGLRTQTRRIMSCPALRKWREGKVRPLPGNPPHDRPVSRGGCSFRRVCDDPFSATSQTPTPSAIAGAEFAFSKAWRNLSGPMWFCQTPGRDRAASRRSAPSPGRRTRREDHALSHRPQMSSDRLFLDQVGRHQSPSPLRRQAQTTTPPAPALPQPDISTLQRIGHFYFALTG